MRKNIKDVNVFIKSEVYHPRLINYLEFLYNSIADWPLSYYLLITPAYLNAKPFYFYYDMSVEESPFKFECSNFKIPDH